MDSANRAQLSAYRGGEAKQGEELVRNYSRTIDRISSCIHKRQIGFEDFTHGNYNFNKAAQKERANFLRLFLYYFVKTKYLILL